MYYVYILRCADNTLYTGYTTEVTRRIALHNKGQGARYTRGRLPVALVHLESFDTQSAAMKREYEIKQLPRWKKEMLIVESSVEEQDLS